MSNNHFFSNHALLRLHQRDLQKKAIYKTIEVGRKSQAKINRTKYQLNLPCTEALVSSESFEKPVSIFVIVAEDGTIVTCWKRSCGGGQ